MSNCDLVMKVERFVGTSILRWRYVSKACVKRGIGFTELDKLLTSWANLQIPPSEVLLVGSLE